MINGMKEWTGEPDKANKSNVDENATETFLS